MKFFMNKIKKDKEDRERDTEKLVAITLSIPRNYRAQLTKMAAEASLKNPDEFKSISQLGREIITKYLERLREKERSSKK